MDKFCENPALLAENLVAIGKAGSLFPVKVSRPTLERWLRRGVENGVILESVKIGSRRFTSLEAVSRFLHRQQKNNQTQPTITKPSMSASKLKSTRKKYGWPEPSEN